MSHPGFPPGVVALGAHIAIELKDETGGAEALEFDIVPDPQADFPSGCLGASTPLARAIMGVPEGSTVPYRSADIVAVRILRVTPGERSAGASAAGEREAAARHAEARARVEQDIQLALTAHSKWGDYDPAPLEGPLPDGHDEPA